MHGHEPHRIRKFTLQLSHPLVREKRDDPAALNVVLQIFEKFLKTISCQKWFLFPCRRETQHRLQDRVPTVQPELPDQIHQRAFSTQFFGSDKFVGLAYRTEYAHAGIHAGENAPESRFVSSRGKLFPELLAGNTKL